ncbi:MAG: RAMP superfamily CRISPR-associated protein [Gemmataceae bacterium]
MSAHWTLNDTFMIRLTMLSDWHVGSGMGRPGSVDRLVTRDADGLPFVPAKTLRGIWRDACERLARGLDNGLDGRWSSLVDRVFGSQPALGAHGPTRLHHDPAAKPIESALMVRPVRLSPELRQRVRGQGALIEAMTFVKPGVRIDRRSGRAQTDFLRFEEMARGGTVLEAVCSIHLPPASEELREAVSALLLAGTRLVERLGGKRRRGAGRCELVVLNHAADHKVITWLEHHQDPPDWPDNPAIASSPTSGKAVPPCDPWVTVPLVLQLTSPLAVSYRTVGNVVETLDYLPGSYLLPHITTVLGSFVPDIRQAIQRGEVRVLPATLEIGGTRGRPVPLALFADKMHPEQVVNRLLLEEPSAQAKQLREGYIAAGHSPRKPPKVVQTHNTVEDRRQRPTTDVGGVYTYEAISPVDEGQPVRLRSELRLRKSLADSLPPGWTDRLSRPVVLGRSKKDDYGEVILEAGQASSLPSSVHGGNELIVWVLSDLLLRDDRLRPAPTAEALGNELGRRLGVMLTVREPDHRLSALIRVRRLDTWHVGWGLPRPSLVAMQAGSCVVFSSNEPIDSSRLQEIEASGIGERTAEGYGQICINDPLLATPPTLARGETLVKQQHQPAGPLTSLDADNLACAHLLEAEVWKQGIRRAALGIAADRARRQDVLRWDVGSSRPPMSQLGGLRSQISQLLQREGATTAISWLEHLKQNKKREGKWPDGAIHALLALLRQPERVWEILDYQQWSTLTEGAQDRLKRDLWPLAVRTLIDACIRAHKREVEVKHGA